MKLSLGLWDFFRITKAIRRTQQRPRIRDWRPVASPAERLEDRTLLAIPVTYVDSNWAGLTNGTDPDGAGAAQAFGVDAFATIQDGVDAVDDGGAVMIHPGTYAESVSISKNVTLTGATGTASDVLLDPPAGSNGFTLTGLIDVTLQNLTVTGAKDGLNATDVSDLALTNVSLSGNADHGLEVTGADSVTVTSSTFNDNDDDNDSIGDGLHLVGITGAVSTAQVTATGNDPGVFITGAASYSDTDSDFSNNDDHGIQLIDIAGDVTLTRTVADDNDVDDDGIGDGLNATDGADGDALAIGGNLIIRGARFRDSGGAADHQEHGVYVLGVGGNVQFENSTGLAQSVLATGNENDGVHIENGSTATFKDFLGTFDGNGDDGIELTNFSGAINIQTQQAGSNGDDGIRVDQAASLSVTTSFPGGNVDDGVDASNITGTVSIVGGSLSFNGEHGVEVNSIGGLTLNNAIAIANGQGAGSGDGVHGTNVGGIVDIDIGLFTSNDGNGINLSGTWTTLTADGVTANSNSGDGISISGTGSATFTGITASANTGDGLNVVSSGTTTLDGGTYAGILVRDSNTVATQNDTVTSTRRVDIEANNDITLDAGIDGSDQTIRIAANVDGAGSDGFVQTSSGFVKTTNDTALAMVITVNTLLGGDGDALLGSIDAGTTAGPTGGRVSVNALMGGVFDNNDGVSVNNITAGNAILNGVAGVGTSANPIETTITNLEGSGTTGGFFVEDVDGLNIGGISAVVGISTQTGDIAVVANGELTVGEDVIGGGNVDLRAGETLGANDDLTVTNGVTVRSVNGNVSLQAGDDVTLEAGSLVESLSGTVEIKIDCDNADANGQMALIDGTINSDLGATVLGDTDADTIIVNAMGTGGLLLDGLEDGDSYTITYPDLPSTFGSTITVDDSGTTSGDLVIVNGTNAADELFLTTEDPPTTATTEEVSRGSLGLEPIVLHDNLEGLRINLLDEPDLIHAQPSMLFPITLDGGEPCFGDQGVPPGDVLDFQPLGNTFTISGLTIFTDGGSPDPFQSVTFVDFESVPITPQGITPGGLPISFDFNHTNTAGTVFESPTQAGYVGVRPDSQYAGGLGYGWQSAVGSFERNDGFYSGTFADLIRDGHWLDSATTFTVDLAGGYYLVSVMLGSPYTSVTGVGIENADTSGTLAAGITTGPGESAHVSFIVNVTDGTLDLRFLPSSVHPEIFAVNGISIRPAEILSMGLNCPPDGLVADGVSVDTFTLYEAPPDSLVTVSTTLGTVLNADADPELAGIQVLTDSQGQATILLQRPFGAGTAIVILESVDGAKTGATAINYVLPDGRNFDFNHVNTNSAAGASPTQAPVASAGNPNGFIGVTQTLLYSPATSFGWLSSPRGFDNGATPDPLGDLKRDGAYDAVSRTFRVALPNGTYQATATIGYDRDIDGMQITVNGTPVATNLSVNATDRLQVTFSFTVSSGIADFLFSDAGGTAPNWTINGLQIRSQVAVSPITFTPNIGTVSADGQSIVPITAISSLGAGVQVTVTSTVGMITSADVNPNIDGVQVLTGSGGSISFNLQAPSLTGTPLLTASSLDGLHYGSVQSPTYLTFAISNARRFDFNHVRSTSSTGPSPTAAGFIGVLRTDTTPATTGYGWTVSPNSYDVGVPNAFDQGGSNAYSVSTTDLYRDYHSGHVSLGPRTFRVQVQTGSLYDVRAYIGSQDRDTANRVSVEGVVGSQSLNRPAKSFGTLTFLDASDANADGFIDIAFDSPGGFSPLWMANGVDITDANGVLPGPATLLAAVSAQGDAAQPLTDAELQLLVAIARDAWYLQGLSPAEAELLQTVEFVISNLGTGALGTADGVRIILDDDAAGLGWSTQPGSVSANRYDLLTVIAHELGHVLGHDHSHDPDDLMFDLLQPGLRHNSLNGIDGFFMTVIDGLP